MRGLLIAALCGGAALGPALAWADGPGAATMLANEGPPENWRANGVAGQTAVTIATGQTVTFSNAGHEYHNLDFQTPGSGCAGQPASAAAPGWSVPCTFNTPGTYAFQCDFHPGMVGRVIVEAPAATTPTPEGTATPVAAATPAGATATPTPPTRTPAKLSVSLASHQRGTRVQGTIKVPTEGSRLEVILRAHGSRVGRWVAGKAAKGTARFSVTVSARARRARPVAIAVTVVLTPPGGKALTRREAVTLRR